LRQILTRLWRTNRLLVIAFSFAAGLTLFFAVRTITFYAYWSAHQNAPIEPWMTAGYISKSYRVPLEVVTDALGIPEAARDRRPIGRIAHERGTPLAQLVLDVHDAIETERRSRSNPPPKP
jgi:hypothetical protein